MDLRQISPTSVRRVVSVRALKPSCSPFGQRQQLLQCWQDASRRSWRYLAARTTSCSLLHPRNGLMFSLMNYLPQLASMQLLSAQSARGQLSAFASRESRLHYGLVGGIISGEGGT